MPKTPEEVLNAVFLHGWLTPTEYGNLPKDQMTIAEGLKELEKYYKEKYAKN